MDVFEGGQESGGKVNLFCHWVMSVGLLILSPLVDVYSIYLSYLRTVFHLKAFHSKRCHEMNHKATIESDKVVCFTT